MILFGEGGKRVGMEEDMSVALPPLNGFLAQDLVRNSRGCTGFVGSDGKPVPLTEQEILDLGVERREISVGFELGDTVKVIDGQLEGFLGTVDEIDPEGNSVRLIVSMFGRETPIDLELDQVEPVKEE